MAHAFTPGLKRRPSIVIKRVRELVVPGKLSVKIGDRVNSQDIIGKAELLGETTIVRLGELLGIEPFEVKKGLRIKEGDTIQKGDLLCEHAGLFGLFKNRSFAPTDGRVEFISEKTGHVGLRLSSKYLELKAYLSGKVVDINPEKSVTIESHCALVQGIFGVGGEAYGRLKAIEISPDREILAEHIPSSVQGEILFGGARPSIDAINKAASSGAVGLITGSIDDSTLAQYLGYDLGLALTGSEEVPMVLIITEGFGKLALSSYTLELLKKFENQEASINGTTQVRAGAIRPEIIINHKVYQENNSESLQNYQSDTLVVGSRVRIIRVPYFGVRATVVELPHIVEVIETGAYARVLRAQLDDGNIVTVPRANVEL